MKTGVSLALLFFFFVLMEVAFLHAFSGVVASIPLMIVAGMIIMQRVGIEEGIAWFLASAVLRGDGISLLLAGIGPMLILQIFTTRSVYALLGFGAAAYGIAGITFILFGKFLDYVFGVSILSSHPVLHALQEGALLLPALFVGVLIVRSVERRVLTQFTFRSTP